MASIRSLALTTMTPGGSSGTGRDSISVEFHTSIGTASQFLFPVALSVVSITANSRYRSVMSISPPLCPATAPSPGSKSSPHHRPLRALLHTPVPSDTLLTLLPCLPVSPDDGGPPYRSP